MSLWKELLLWIILMNILTTASKPIVGEIQQLELSLCNLKKAEKDYVELMFNEPPKEYETNHLPLIQGVTLPAGNSTAEIQTSLCAISDYLSHHLHSIIRNLTEHGQELIINTSAFHRQFKEVVEVATWPEDTDSFLKKCHQEISASGRYNLKVIGLQIIYSARRWVESFLDAPPICDYQI